MRRPLRVVRDSAVVVAMTALLLTGFEWGARAWLSEPFYVPHPEDPALLMYNIGFSEQFFGTRWQTAPHAHVLDAEKAPGTRRIFVLGGSAAFGYPDSVFSFSRILGAKLEAVLPDVPVEVVNVAMPGTDSTVAALLAQELVRHEPDLFIVYSGNNEWSGPFGFLGPGQPKRAWADRVRRTFRGTLRLMGRLSPPPDHANNAEPPDLWAPLEDRGALQAYVTQRYVANMGRISRIARRAGVPALVVPPVANAAGYAPLAQSPAPRDAAADEAVADWLAAAPSDDCEGAVEALRRLAPRDAEAMWQAAEAWTDCQPDLRGVLYEKSVQWDTLPLRSDRSLREALAAAPGWRAALELHAALDAATINADGDVANRYFVDHCHLTWRGNAEVATRLLPRVLEALGFDPATAAGTVPAGTALRRALGYSSGHAYNAARAVLGAQERPPFRDRLNYDAWKAVWEQRQQAAAGEINPFRLAPFIAAQERRAQRTGDWETHRNLAQLYGALGRTDEALRAWQAAAAHPASPEPALAGLGQTLLAMEAPAEAVEVFQRLRAQAPWRADVYVGLAHAQAALKEYEAAARAFAEATALAPRAPHLYGEWAGMWREAGDLDTAHEVLMAGLAANPEEPTLYFALGIVHAELDCWRAAEQAFACAVALAPDDEEFRRAHADAAAWGGADAATCPTPPPCAAPAAGQ